MLGSLRIGGSKALLANLVGLEGLELVGRPFGVWKDQALIGNQAGLESPILVMATVFQDSPMNRIMHKGRGVHARLNASIAQNIFAEGFRVVTIVKAVRWVSSLRSSVLGLL